MATWRDLGNRGGSASHYGAGLPSWRAGIRSAPFADRVDAGKRLAAVLAEDPPADPVVLGLPRGGVVVAAPVAKALNAPLDVVVVRKLGHPLQPELAVGAIGEGDVEVINPQVAPTVDARDLDRVRDSERAELRRRVAMYRGGRQATSIEDRNVILVDDGLATGSTARAAIDVLRARGARSITLAVPVGPPSTVRSFERLVDRVVCLQAPSNFGGVGQFYRDFAQTTDDEVSAILGT